MKTEHILIGAAVVVGAFVAYKVWQKSQQPTAQVGNAIMATPSNGNDQQRNDGTASTITAISNAATGVLDELQSLGSTFGGF